MSPFFGAAIVVMGVALTTSALLALLGWIDHRSVAFKYPVGSCVELKFDVPRRVKITGHHYGTGPWNEHGRDPAVYVYRYLDDAVTGVVLPNGSNYGHPVARGAVEKNQVRQFNGFTRRVECGDLRSEGSA